MEIQIKSEIAPDCPAWWQGCSLHRIGCGGVHSRIGLKSYSFKSLAILQFLLSIIYYTGTSYKCQMSNVSLMNICRFYVFKEGT